MNVAPPPARPAVRLGNFTRRFGATVLLDGLELAIGAGEFLALLGRSGAGKTTLLRALAGLDTGFEGSIEVPDRRAVVFQEPRLLPWKRVWQNVALGLSGAEPKERALKALEEVGLADRVDAWPMTLSGGEAQRVGLARALVREPDLLLLDEPFAALDALSRLRMQDMLADLWTAHGYAVLLVTHDVDEALLLADRAVVLAEGKIATEIAVGLPRPRRHGDATLDGLRERLLDALGVQQVGRNLFPATRGTRGPE